MTKHYLNLTEAELDARLKAHSKSIVSAEVSPLVMQQLDDLAANRQVTRSEIIRRMLAYGLRRAYKGKG